MRWKWSLVIMLISLAGVAAGWLLAKGVIRLSHRPVVGANDRSPLQKDRETRIATSSASQPFLATSSKRPNVILISLDTVRPDHLGCYGYRHPTSPNLDRFSRQSVLFKNVHAQAPWTLPSHMSLFTSMLPSHNGVDDINKALAPEVPILAGILRQHGYHTAALVNNGQMMAHWGFSRGFDLWREFKADTPESSCEAITREAQRWLDSAPPPPFFLFLHYYDAHLPYDPPAAYKTRFGSALTGDETRDLAFGARFPNRPIPENQLKQLIGSYDGEIAWLDHEVGKLLSNIPAHTLVVIFSDHGEEFKEHGWMLHGATLHEGAIQCVLMIRPPDDHPGAKVIENPVMLLDVAPTILSLCGLRAPPGFEGMDVQRLWKEGGKLPERVILSETKAVLEGRVARMVMIPPWKLSWSLFDAAAELHRLPDERVNLSKKEPEAARSLLKIMRSWMAEEDFWILYAHGSGEFDVKLTLSNGRFAVFIPAGLEPERDEFSPSPDGRMLQWISHPGGKTKALFFQPSPSDAAVTVDIRHNGSAQPGQLFIGAKGSHPGKIPVDLTLEDSTMHPMIEQAFHPKGEGVWVRRYRAGNPPPRPSRISELDEPTRRQLRSLGYLP
ncbi:MAG: sulfatase [Verrucomicrobia bacterium]|nr:sulfatase [Verrucomicrobiota bacterium]